MADSITHYVPNAVVFFVPSFAENKEVADTLLDVQYVLGVQELSSINISYTVKNHPGSFSLTIVDTANKYVELDDADSDIQALYDYSQNKILMQDQVKTTKSITKTTTTTTTTTTSKITSKVDITVKTSDGLTGNVSQIADDNAPPQRVDSGEKIVDTKWKKLPTVVNAVVPLDHANNCTSQSYNDWCNELHIVVVGANGRRYPTQLIKDKTGKVIQRWTFDDQGNILLVSDNTDTKPKNVPTDEELATQLVNNNGRIDNASILFIDLDNTKESAPSIAGYSILAFKNRELTEGRRDIDEQGTIPGKFNRGKCKISPMDRVVIYLSPRFDPVTHTKIEGTAPYLIRAFTGVVNNVQQEYSENRNLITVTGEDVTKYLKISIINTNPALLIDPKNVVDQNAEDRAQVWQSILQGLTTPEIIRMLCEGTKNLHSSPKPTDGKVTDITSVAYIKMSKTEKASTAEVWDVNERALRQWKEGDPIIDKNTTTIRVADYSAMLGALFTSTDVHIINPYRKGTPLVGFRPYELSFKNAYSFYQADFKTRRDIAYKCAEDSNFNFYADRRGDIWFHPQRFDLSWILGAENPNLYIIDNASIISYGFIESDDNIFTSIYVTTEPDLGMESITTIGYYAASYRDDPSTLKYGQRQFISSNPVIDTKKHSNYNQLTEKQQQEADEQPKKNILLYAKSLLQRLLASKYQGQITIPLRAEIDAGRSIYIPIRNMVYYVETVEHAVTFGGQATTTLHLSYGRKPWELLPELLTYNAYDEIYITDADTIKETRDIYNPSNDNKNAPNTSQGGSVGETREDLFDRWIPDIYTKYQASAKKFANISTSDGKSITSDISYIHILALITIESGGFIVQGQTSLQILGPAIERLGGVKAVGIMQMLPDTYTTVVVPNMKARLKNDDGNVKKLFNTVNYPTAKALKTDDNNIQACAFYLQTQLEKWGSIELAVRNYNPGETSATSQNNNGMDYYNQFAYCFDYITEHAAKFS